MSEKFDPELKAAWVAALRSGKYEQAKGQLCKVNQQRGTRSHCCLGVLHEVVHGPDGWGQPGVSCSIDALSYYGPGYSRLSEFVVSDLTKLNDSTNVGFEGIADYIEKHLKWKSKPVI